MLLPIFSAKAQFAVVRVLARAHAGPLVVLLHVTWPALSDIEPMGLLIVAERVVQAASPGSPGTFFLPTIYHELHAETIADVLVARDVLPAVCGAVALEGYWVRLLFNDATVRDVDLAPYIAGDPRFEPLRSDLAYFRAFRVAGGTLAWPNGAEIAAETLYLLDPPAAKELPTTTTYTAIFAESDGWVVGWVRELPGAIAQERTIEEARESLKEVIALLLEEREATDETHIIAREPITVG